MIYQTIIIYLSITFFLIGAIGAAYRVVRGPSIVDRTIGVDTLITIFLSILIADIILNGKQERIFIAITIALLSLIGTVAIAKYVSGDHTQTTETQSIHILKNKAKTNGK